MIGSDDMQYGLGAPTTNRPISVYKKRRTLKVAIEGNIASGKSTLLEKLQQLNQIEVLMEPVEKWQNLSGGNLIGQMYRDAERWGYLFQSYVLLTMMEIHHKEVKSPIAMLERSVYSARYCFVENLHNNGILNDMEYACYCKWFDCITKQNPPKLDLIVYLRSSPDVCYRRLQQRGRKEEKPVTLEYLHSLHDHYEEWLGNEKHHSWHGNVPVLVIDADEDSSNNLHVFSKHCSSVFDKLGIAECRPAIPLK